MQIRWVCGILKLTKTKSTECQPGWKHKNDIFKKWVKTFKPVSKWLLHFWTKTRFYVEMALCGNCLCQSDWHPSRYRYYYVSPLYTEVGTYCFTPVRSVCLRLSVCVTWSVNLSPIHFSPALSIVQAIKHKYNICTTSAQRLRRWSNIVQMLYKYFVFTGLNAAQQTGGDEPVLVWLWASVADSGSELDQHWVNVVFAGTDDKCFAPKWNNNYIYLQKPLTP